MPGLFESRVILYNMKYCIFGFNQQKVLGLTKEVKDEKKDKFITISIDVEDLLILSVIADLANRKSIRKVVHDDGQYAWISYNVILEDLPILRIDKKQLRRRLDKLVEFDLIDLKVERINGSGTFVFIKIGKGYEELKYNTGEDCNNTGRQKCTEGVDKNVQGGGQKCTPKDYIIKQDYDNNKKEERDKSLSKKSFDFLSALLSIGIEEQIAKDWMKIRTSKKASDSETAFKQLKTALESINNTYGISATDAIGICVTNGWYGCKPSYFENIRLDDYGFGTQTSLLQQNNGKDWQ